jgi:hypothetical protein
VYDVLYQSPEPVSPQAGDRQASRQDDFRV